LTLPGFNVHQDFDNVLMNGERDGQGNGTESEIYGRVQAGGIAVGGIRRHQPSGAAARDAGVESGELDAAQAKWKVADGVRSEANEGFASGVGSREHRLRRELANTKLDLEIVKKAATYFAKESR
jgi:hypothetical protein